MTLFLLSKLFWFLVQPGNFLVLLLVAALVLERLHARRAAQAIVAAVTVSLCAILLLPIDQWLARPLENRLQRPAPPACLDGILVLGGGEQPRISASRGVPTAGDAGRYSAVMALQRRYPTARIVFSGAGGEAHPGPATEAATAAKLFAELGLAPARLTIETQSRNTWENLVDSRRLVRPRRGETWLLVTSALHMPRSIGVARAIGWPMLPWPTDYRTPGDGGPPVLRWSLAQNLGVLDLAAKEWLGLAAYRVLGRTAEWFPGPEPVPAGGCARAVGGPG